MDVELPSNKIKPITPEEARRSSGGHEPGGNPRNPKDVSPLRPRVYKKVSTSFKKTLPELLLLPDIPADTLGTGDPHGPQTDERRT